MNRASVSLSLGGVPPWARLKAEANRLQPAASVIPDRTSLVQYSLRAIDMQLSAVEKRLADRKLAQFYTDGPIAADLIGAVTGIALDPQPRPESSRLPQNLFPVVVKTRSREYTLQSHREQQFD
jgi:hypothetical protein